MTLEIGEPKDSALLEENVTVAVVVHTRRQDSRGQFEQSRPSLVGGHTNSTLLHDQVSNFFQ